MKIVMDSNVLFSALIKDSLTRKIILEYDDLFLFPEFIFEETNNHIEELLTKSKMKKEDFDLLLKSLLNKVFIVPNENLLNYKEEALDIVKNIDIDDAVFFACALNYKNSIIWSDDKKLKLQNKIKILNTSEIKNLI
jgi:predicted nucleic acid-binding protein